ncbi:MAG TPA: hypothetical protein VLE97_00515 [Gaiellaceae bacterium]|nr:hypothetical protein [Gaiellaceae bacterium]
MKKLLLLVIAVAALAAVPVALGDDNPPPPSIQTTPSGQTQGPGQGQGRNQGQGQSQGQRQGAGARVQMIRMRLMMIERRFIKRCGTDSSKASQECIDFAKKALDHLNTLDTRLKAAIAKGGENADRLQKLDDHVQALAKKVQDWLGSQA